MKKFPLSKLLPVFFGVFIFFAANAQRLPNVQQVSLRAPADIKIDGKATEWNNHFQAYNDTTHVYYTIANDDKNLYLTVQASDRGIIRMIMVNGVSFTIDRLRRVKKDLFNNYYPSITYPTREKENGTYGYGVYVDSSETKLRMDSFAMAYNRHLAADSKYIRVTGIRTLAELTLINNRGGIKVASMFDNKMVYTYELAIDLSLLGLDAAKSEKFDYNIAIGEGHISEFSRAQGARIISVSYTAQPNDPYNPHGYIPADFWGEYTLAK